MITKNLSHFLEFFLYDWSSNKLNDTGLVEEKATYKLAISIDEYANRIPELLKSLTGALSTISHKIGATRDSFTIPIYLGKFIYSKFTNIDYIEYKILNSL